MSSLYTVGKRNATLRPHTISPKLQYEGLYKSPRKILDAGLTDFLNAFFREDQLFMISDK